MHGLYAVHIPNRKISREKLCATKTRDDEKCLGVPVCVNFSFLSKMMMINAHFWAESRFTNEPHYTLKWNKFIFVFAWLCNSV